MADELKVRLIKENRIMQNMIRNSIERIIRLNPDISYPDLLRIYASNTKDFNFIGIDIIELYKKESNYHET